MNNVVIAGSRSAASYAKLYALESKFMTSVTAERVLRFEVPLENGKQDYRINMQASTGSGDRHLENKLERNSIFGMIAIAMGIQKADDANGGNQANYDLHHSPHADFTAAENNGIRVLYNGTLTVKVKTKEEIPQMSTSLLRFDPGTDNVVVGPTAEERGFHFTKKVAVFDGDQDNELIISLPSGQDLSTLVPAGEHRVLVVEILGMYTNGDAQGGNGLACLS